MIRKKVYSLQFTVYGFLFLLFTVHCSLCTDSYAQDKLLIDDFEGAVSGGPAGTVDYGSGNGSSVEVTAAADVRQSGSQSLKIVYDAVPGGYIWVARGAGLDAKNSSWLVNPEDIDWKKYDTVSFYIYGADSKVRIAFDIKDNGGEIWRFIIDDGFKGWKEFDCSFADFFARDDWQPDSAEKNGRLDFPLKSYQFEPLPEAKGAIYVDDVELIKRKG